MEVLISDIGIQWNTSTGKLLVYMYLVIEWDFSCEKNDILKLNDITWDKVHITRSITLY